MARYRRIIRALLAPAVYVWRRWPKITILTAIVLTLAYVPIVPLDPTCWNLYFRRKLDPGTPYPEGFSRRWWSDQVKIEGPMSKEYTENLTEFLTNFGITHIRIGNNNFITFWDFIDDPTDLVVNANAYALRYTAAPEDGRTWKPMPEEFQAMALSLESPGRVIDHCELARAVAIENWGRPPASGTAQSPGP